MVTARTLIPPSIENPAEDETDEIICIRQPEKNREDKWLEWTVEMPASLKMALGDAEIASGLLLVTFHGKVEIIEDQVLRIPESVNFSVQSRPRRLQYDDSSFSWTNGNKTVAIVRVSAPDSQPMYSMKEIVDALLGEDRVSMKTQYEACSFRKLQLVGNGTFDVLLDQNMSFYSTRTAMRVAAEAALADMTGTPVNQLADKVVFCYASNPAHAPWLAVASMYHWRVQLNDAWCTSLSGSIHEIGHTIGFRHSGRGSDDYGDATCYMGAGGRAALQPQKCFNGAKLAQSGWFRDRQLSLMVDNIVDLYFPIPLVAFVDAGRLEPSSAEPTPVVLIAIDDYLYLVYNRADSFNREVGAARDQVAITQDGRDRSRHLAGLKPNETFVLTNYTAAGDDLHVTVCAVSNSTLTGDSSVDTAWIGLGLNSDGPCAAPRCFDTGAELRAAVAEYLRDPQRNTSVARTYGFPIGSWCVDHVENFSSVFEGAAGFDEPLDGWRTSSATTLRRMFRGAARFRQDLSHFDVTRVTDMAELLRGATAFDASLCAWRAVLPAAARTRGAFSGTACPVMDAPRFVDGQWRNLCRACD